MYRGVSLFALRNGMVERGEIRQRELLQKLPDIVLSFQLNAQGEPELLLNGQNVAREIRSPEVSSIVSKVATIREVREKLVDAQRQIGAEGGIVMDGRDIGSVVFPNAELKIFVTADIQTRATRRYAELKGQGVEISRDEVIDNLTERDLIDSTREISPLVQAKDAILLDNSKMSREEQLEVVFGMVQDTLYHKTRF
jgi:cytidylate kinase